MHKVTDRQLEVLRFIQEYARDFGRTPYRGEIARRFGIVLSAASAHVDCLRRHKLVLVEKRTREIVLPASPLPEPEKFPGVDIDAVHRRFDSQPAQA